jgi:hypothetical protein
MKAQVIEISGYTGAFMSLYMTGKNVDEARLKDILNTISCCTDRYGCLIDDNEYVMNKEEEFDKFSSYMDKVIKYGIQHEHETLLDFIKITIFMQDLHRGAMDDYDSHAKRMDIIRSSTRANKKSSGGAAGLSDWYADKVMTFDEMLEHNSMGDQIFEGEIELSDGVWIKTPWGYVREEYVNNPDVLRGLVPLGLACDNVSTVSYRNLRHIYHLRREGTHASPELQEAMEQVRDDLRIKCPTLGDMLGKVWVPGANEYIEKPDTIVTIKGE